VIGVPLSLILLLLLFETLSVFLSGIRVELLGVFEILKEEIKIIFVHLDTYYKEFKEDLIRK
jgi:hypothetical protein